MNIEELKAVGAIASSLVAFGALCWSIMTWRRVRAQQRADAARTGVDALLCDEDYLFVRNVLRRRATPVVAPSRWVSLNYHPEPGKSNIAPRRDPNIFSHTHSELMLALNLEGGYDKPDLSKLLLYQYAIVSTFERISAIAMAVERKEINLKGLVPLKGIWEPISTPIICNCDEDNENCVQREKDRVALNQRVRDFLSEERLDVSVRLLDRIVTMSHKS